MDSKWASASLGFLQQNRTLLTAAAIVLGSAPVLSFAVSDYRAWLALGSNGLPSNIFGYLFQTTSRLFARSDTRVPAPYDGTRVSSRYGPDSRRSFLAAPLPPRTGPRPEIPSFVAPHRQTSQRCTADMAARQKLFMRALAAANPAVLQVKPSDLEGPNYPALWLAEGIIPARPETRSMNGEFLHPHGEGSTHLVLSLADATMAIESGWAERHRMSGVIPLIPWNFVLIYAPRTNDEFRIWSEIVLASARYIVDGRELVTK
ncbi:hypothetical protein F4779DRAFT_240989 [Xylariaceae sp. FL0662B]|nr:hypothetical protein F4779DRAFT_240989 [Xylariaceae sp. FL0662B]